MSQYSSQTSTKTTLLKDKSWIRKTDDEDEDIDRDPNFGKSVLSQYRSGETPAGAETEGIQTTKTISKSTSVQALTKRFSGSQNELRSSTLPTSSSYTKRTYSSQDSDSPYTTTTSRTIVTEDPKTSTTTTMFNKDGKTTETTVTTTESVRSSGIKSPTKTETFTERVMSSSKGSLYSTYSPTRTTRETTVASSKDAEDKLYDKLIPSSIRGDLSPTDSAEDKLYNKRIPFSSSIRDDFSPTDSNTTISSTKTVTVKSSTNGDGTKTTTTTRTSSMAEDDLYDTLLPKAIKSGLSSPASSSSSSSITKREIYTVESSRGGESPTLTSPSSTRRTFSYSSYDEVPTSRTTSYSISTKPSDKYSSENYYSRPDSSYEYSSITSPTVYTTSSYRSNSRSDDKLPDQIYSKSSTKSAYGAPERTVLEKDLCTSCRKPFTSDAKIVLEDMKINCHASCFKCEVCNSTLGHMKAGDSMWIYKHMVHCENCFEITRDKWRR